MIGRAKLDVHYAPGEHDILDPKTRDAYLERFGKGATGGGWYAFDHGGVHFMSLDNVVDLKKNGLGSLGAEQLEWLEDDLRGKSASTPIVIFSHIPLWMIAPEWGWGTEDSAQALGYLARFGSVTVLNGHIHQLMQKVEGTVTSTPRARPPFRSPRQERRLRRDPSSCRRANCANGSASGKSPIPSRPPMSPSQTQICREAAPDEPIALVRTPLLRSPSRDGPPTLRGRGASCPCARPRAKGASTRVPLTRFCAGERICCCCAPLSRNLGGACGNRMGGRAHRRCQSRRRLYEACQDCHSLDKNDVGLRHRGVFGQRGGLAPEHAAMARADIVLVERVAILAGLVERLAAIGIACEPARPCGFRKRRRDCG